jgi:hypothetical protein
MTTNDTDNDTDNICSCNIKDNTNIICVNCEKTIVLPNNDVLIRVISGGESTIKSSESKIVSGDSKNFTELLTIGQPFEHRLDYFIKKNNIRCILSIVFILLFIIVTLILLIVNK